MVNAANEKLLGGGGIDGVIHTAAGGKLRSECELLEEISAGMVAVTHGWDLPANIIIHAVGPRGENPTALKSVYENAFNRANELRCTSLVRKISFKSLRDCKKENLGNSMHLDGNFYVSEGQSCQDRLRNTSQASQWST